MDCLSISPHRCSSELISGGIWCLQLLTNWVLSLSKHLCGRAHISQQPNASNCLCWLAFRPIVHLVIRPSRLVSASCVHWWAVAGHVSTSSLFPSWTTFSDQCRMGTPHRSCKCGDVIQPPQFTFIHLNIHLCWFSLSQRCYLLPEAQFPWWSYQCYSLYHFIIILWLISVSVCTICFTFTLLLGIKIQLEDFEIINKSIQLFFLTGIMIMHRTQPRKPDRMLDGRMLCLGPVLCLLWLVLQ